MAEEKGRVTVVDVLKERAEALGPVAAAQADAAAVVERSAVPFEAFAAPNLWRDPEPDHVERSHHQAPEVALPRMLFSP